MKRLKLSFASLLICFAVFTTANASGGKTGALLWKVSGSNLEKPSYILGTFHIASKAMLDSISGANAALNDCEQVVGEVMITEMMEQPQKIQLAGMMSADTTYQMLYSEDEYKKVNAVVMESFGVGLDMVGTLKPSMLLTSISVLIYQKFFPDFKQDEIMDAYVQQYALTAGKPIIALESLDDQIYAIFNSSSLKRQAEQLLCLVENMEYVRMEALNLMEAYNKADLETLRSMVEDDMSPCSSTQEEKEILIYNRNDNWVKKLPAIMQEKSSFIAVGAGHLAGEAGILVQLEKLGYRVEAVR